MKKPIFFKMSLLFLALSTLISPLTAKTCKKVLILDKKRMVCFPDSHRCFDPHGIGDGVPIEIDCFTEGTRACHPDSSFGTWPKCAGGWIQQKSTEIRKSDFCTVAKQQLKKIKDTYLSKSNHLSCLDNNDCSYRQTHSSVNFYAINKKGLAEYAIMEGDQNYQRLLEIKQRNCPDQSHIMVIFLKPEGAFCQDNICKIRQ